MSQIAINKSIGDRHQRVWGWIASTRALVGKLKRHNRPRRLDVHNHWQPAVRLLEPRLVLNATAELNPLGQLLITGTDASDFVQLSVNPDNHLSITDQAGVAIPIANHPAGQDFSSDPIALDAITAQRIRIDLGDGDDTVVMPLLSGFDVSVADSLGDDFVSLESTASTTPVDGSLRVSSETIEISSQGSAFRLGGIETRLVGNVQVSEPVLVNQIHIDDLLRVDGTLTLENDLVIRGDGSLNLSGATLSATDPSVDLLIELPGGDVRLGEVNDSAGNAIENLVVTSASNFYLRGDDALVANDWQVQNVDSQILIDSNITAESITLSSEQQILLFGNLESNQSIILESDDVFIREDVRSIEGDIEIQTMDRFTLARGATLSTTSASGSILLAGGGGNIDTSAGELSSLGSDEAITIQDASEVILGNVSAVDGVLTLGTPSNTVATVVQALGTAVSVGRVSGVVSDLLDLSHENNAIDSVGALTAGGNARIQDSGGDLRVDDLVVAGNQVEITSAGVMQIGRIDASEASLRLNATQVLDATDDRQIDITANRLELMAETGLDSSQALEIDSVGELVAAVAQGDLFIESLGSTPLRVLSAVTQDGSFNLTAAGDVELGLVDTTAGGVTVSTSGAIDIGNVNAMGQSVVLQGTVINDALGDLNDSVGDIVASDISLISTLGIGNVLALELDQVDSLRAITSTGDIDLRSLGANPLVIEQASTGDGNVTLDVAGNAQANAISSTSGNVTLTSLGEIVVGSIDAVTGTISLVGRTIEDLDPDDDQMPVADFSATNLDLVAREGIGAQRTLELDRVSQLSAVNAMGNVNLESLGSDTLVVEELSTSEGSLSLVANGSVSATRIQLGQVDQTGTASDPCSNLASSTEDFEIQIWLNGVASDLQVGEILAFGDSDVFLTVDGDITSFGNTPTNLIADDLSLVVGNETPNANSGVFLRTRINELVASLTSANGGDLIIEELDSICLASSDARVDSIVQVATGKVDVTAGEVTGNELSTVDTIFVVDHDASMQDADLKGDPEILAADALNGSVFLSASRVVLGENVQIHLGEANSDPLAAPQTINGFEDQNLDLDQRVISIRTDNFVVDENVELFSGDDQGTARQFTQRPSDPNVPDEDNSEPFAFFDPTTVDVNVLTQALENDATGILDFDIGTPGEHGLTVVVDWGDSNGRRFQQIDNLSADQGYVVGIAPDAAGSPLPPIASQGTQGELQLTHLYLQEDVLNSQENGRDAATSPFNVRFAVRHHESIIVQSLTASQDTTVTQNGITSTAPGGVLTSTDDPTTRLQTDFGSSPQLESGTASFFIPPLTIPVAFIPVRDVIPEFETPEVIIVSESSVELTSSSVEATENPSAGSVKQEEYLQLRVRSPDPEAEDLAEPQKLPVDILDGDRLNELFRRLPDGTYEIEYVISEGNERSILRVEVRDGEATIPDSELDEGLLRLRDLKDADTDEEIMPDDPQAGVIDQSEAMLDQTEMIAVDHDSPRKTSESRWSLASRYARRRDG